MSNAQEAESPSPSLVTMPTTATAKIPASTSTTLLSQIHDAQSLLFYAAEAGIDVDDGIRREVLRAAADIGAYSSPDAAANLVAAMTRLTHALSPVTAFSLAACSNGKEVELTVKVYRRVAVFLALLIIPISLVTFVTTSISEATLKDITDANALAVKLTDQESSPKTQTQQDAQGKPDRLPREVNVIRDLQTLAGTTRAVDARARQLNWFVANIVDDPFVADRKNPEAMRQKFDLPAGLPNLSQALTDRISNFQLVRQFAQSARESISTVYGAIAVGILPVLYALLGAVAYLLRSYQQQLKERTFTGADSHVARFVIAAIGGGVVGLFTNFTSGNGAASISPLAIAFLAGYATDVFFSFLDSFVQTFNRGASASSGAPKSKA
jgi:hypothetical protein